MYTTRYPKDEIVFVKGKIEDTIPKTMPSIVPTCVVVYSLRDSKSEKTAKIWLDGWLVYYNFLRSHLILKGKTPAEACGIDLKLENGWKNLIRGATYYQTKLTRFVFNEVEMKTQ